jgi:hypothetical protein
VEHASAYERPTIPVSANRYHCGGSCLLGYQRRCRRRLDMYPMGWVVAVFARRHRWGDGGDVRVQTTESYTALVDETTVD